MERERDRVIAFAAGMRGQIPNIGAEAQSTTASVETMSRALKAVGLKARPISPEALAGLHRMKES